MSAAKVVKLLFHLGNFRDLLDLFAVTGKVNNIGTTLYPFFVAATVGEKVFIHNPHQKMGGHLGGVTPSAGRMESSQANHEIATLNINQVYYQFQAP